MEIRKLNTIRGLAAIIVFVTHFSDITGWLDGSLGGRAGQYGVMLFFLLSGFLMSYLYLGKEFTRVNIYSYALARVSRILPLYLLVVLLSYLFCISGKEVIYNVANMPALISHLTFIYGDNVLWTVAVEVQFYFIFIALWWFQIKWPNCIYLIVSAVLVVLFFTDFLRYEGDIFGAPYNTRIFKSLPYFLVGVVVGMNYKAIVVPTYMKKNIFVLALLLIPLMYPQFSPVNSDANTRMWLSYEVLLVISVVFCSVVFLVPDKNIILSNRLGDFLGKVSYSLYLLHYPIIVQVNKLDTSVEIKLILAAVICMLVSFISYKIFEKPLAEAVRGATSNKLSQQDAVNGASA